MQSQQPQRTTQKIFRPIRAKFMPLNMPLNKLFGTIIAVFVGAAIAFALGGFTVDNTYTLTDKEHQVIWNNYDATRSALQTIEVQRERDKAKTYDAMSLTTTQKQTIEDAAEKGITPNTTDAELDELVPKTQVVNEPMFPVVPRFILLMGLPLLAGFVLFMEINRTSFAKELIRYRAFDASQKVYHNRPIRFVEQTTGEQYWSAIEQISTGKD